MRQAHKQRAAQNHRYAERQAAAPLTPAGRKQLQIEVAQFARVVGAITRVIQAT